MNLYSIPVDNLQHIQLIVSTIHSKTEEKACVSLVNNLQIFVLYEVAHFRFPTDSGIKLYFWLSKNLPEQDCRCEFPTDLFLLLCFLRLVPELHQRQFKFCHSCFQVPTHHFWSLSLPCLLKRMTKWIMMLVLVFWNHQVLARLRTSAIIMMCFILHDMTPWMINSCGNGEGC